MLYIIIYIYLLYVNKVFSKMDNNFINVPNMVSSCNCYSCDIFEYIQNGSKSCIPNTCVDKFKHSSGIPLNTYIGKHTDCSDVNYGGQFINNIKSNYIGPGGDTYRNILNGILPLSLSDHCAILHDIMYALSTSKDESMNADKTFIKNLIYNREYHNEPLVNIEYPLLIANTGVLLGVTAGRIQKGPAWNNPFELFIYSKILQSMYNQKKKIKLL